MEAIQAAPSSDILEAQERDDDVSNIDFKISSTSRPKICTAFEGIQLEESTAIVILSDGSQWKTTSQSIASINWEKGDDIRIKHEKGKTFVLKNVRTGEAFLARSSKKCDDLSKAIFVIDVDCSGYGILTSDGRIWITGFWGARSVRHLKPGDRVVINQSTHSNHDYELINPCKGSPAWVVQVFHDYVLTAKTA